MTSAPAVDPFQADDPNPPARGAGRCRRRQCRERDAAAASRPSRPCRSPRGAARTIVARRLTSTPSMTLAARSAPRHRGSPRRPARIITNSRESAQRCAGPRTRPHQPSPNAGSIDGPDRIQRHRLAVDGGDQRRSTRASPHTPMRRRPGPADRAIPLQPAGALKDAVQPCGARGPAPLHGNPRWRCAVHRLIRSIGPYKKDSVHQVPWSIRSSRPLEPDLITMATCAGFAAAVSSGRAASGRGAPHVRGGYLRPTTSASSDRGDEPRIARAAVRGSGLRGTLQRCATPSTTMGRDPSTPEPSIRA